VNFSCGSWSIAFELIILDKERRMRQSNYPSLFAPSHCFRSRNFCGPLSNLKTLNVPCRFVRIGT
jgi:hypothetical protein